MDVVFLVYHLRDRGDLVPDLKLIGFFSERKFAARAVDRLSKVEGFVDYPGSFTIKPVRLDEMIFPNGFGAERVHGL